MTPENSQTLAMTGDGDSGAASESSLSEAEDTLTLVTKEINRRLSAGRVRDIADGTLFRYHQDLTKWTEKHKQDEESKEVTQFNLLDQIDFLPYDRALELLRHDKKEKEAEVKALDKAIKRINAEQNAERRK
jgi:hypothetical protein